jgi:hypothetical protein
MLKQSFLILVAGASSASAATVAVTQFNPLAGPTSVDAWYLSDVRPGGTATIEDLTGLGGNLENNQPLPTGAARLTTDSTNAAKAEVATFADFGSASDVLRSIDLSYSYYKTTNAELFAAPSLKLTLYSSTGTGDNFGTLVFEPNWNQSGAGSEAVPSGAWQTVTIDENTGSGSTAGGGWWWNGGFEQPSSAAGPPIRSLSEWLTLFQTSDPNDFGTARVVALSVGVGTYNINQIDYFDNVSIKTGNIDKTYDFQPSRSNVPDGGSTLALLGGVLTGLAAFRRKLGA